MPPTSPPKYRKQKREVFIPAFADRHLRYVLEGKQTLVKIPCSRGIDCACKKHRERRHLARIKNMAYAPEAMRKKREQENAQVQRWRDELNESKI